MLIRLEYLKQIAHFLAGITFLIMAFYLANKFWTVDMDSIGDYSFTFFLIFSCIYNLASLCIGISKVRQKSLNELRFKKDTEKISRRIFKWH